MKNYNEILTLQDGVDFLKSQFGSDSSIQVTDGMLGESLVRSFSFIIASNQIKGGLNYGDILFANYSCMVALRPYDSQETISMEFQKPYAKFMYNLIKTRNDVGEIDFSADDYVRGYNAYIEQEYKKKLDKLEAEYFDSIFCYKDKESVEQKGE